MKLTAYRIIKGRQVREFKPGRLKKSAITQRTIAELTVTLVMQMRIPRIPYRNSTNRGNNSAIGVAILVKLVSIKIRLLSIIFTGWLVSASLCGTASARITGNFLLLYDLVKEDGKWSRESEQRINLGLRGTTGLERLLSFNLGFIRSRKEWDILGGYTPTYAVSLQGKHYNLSSGYSIRVYRGSDVVNSQLYGNLSVFLPSLPTFRLIYSEQGIKDTLEESRLDSTGTNMQFSVEDEIGPFRIKLNKRIYTSEDLVRGPEYDMESSNTSGNVDFAYSYRQLLSLNGRYRIGWTDTERVSTGVTESRTQDFSLGFRISPVSTITLSGTTSGGRQQNSSSKTEEFLSTNDSDSLTNRLQLMLQPIEGISLNATYSVSNINREEGNPISNEARSLTVNLKPWQNLTLSGHSMIHDSQEQERRLSTLRRNSFDISAWLLDGLQVSSYLDLSESSNLISGIVSDRDSVITKLAAVLTDNFRTDVSYDWQNSSRRSGTVFDDETQHRITLAGSYSFARMLNLNFSHSRSISSAWEGDTILTNCGLSYSKDESQVSFRYNQMTRPGSSTSISGEQQWTTRTFTISFDQQLGRNADLTLSYENHSGARQFAYSGTDRFSFRLNTRF